MNHLLLYIFGSEQIYLYESNLNGNINIIFNYYFMCLGKKRPKTEFISSRWIRGVAFYHFPC